MRAVMGAVVGLCVTACGAPETSDATSWAVRLTGSQPTAAQSRIIADRLASPDPLDAAWGAYLAGELGVSAMEDSLNGLTQDGALLRETALDALARVGGRIPDGRLRELMTPGDMTAMAVALQEPAVHRDLIFDAFTTAHDTLPRAVDDFHDRGDLTDWRAYANALAWLRDREFAAVLLASLETSIEVRVVSPGEVITGFGCRCGGAFGTSCSGFSHQPFTALPPVGTWSLREARHDDCVVLLPGPTDVCLARIEGRFEEDMRERALAGLPLRPWVSSIGHDAALEVVDGYGREPEEEIEAGVEDLEAPLDEIEEEPEADDASEEPSAEARAACPPDAAIADSDIAVETSPLNDELLSYISALQGEQVSFEGRLSVLHVWTGEETYRSFVEGLRDRMRTAHTAIGRALADAYLLPDGYRQHPPAVQIVATDDRTCGATAALPRL